MTTANPQHNGTMTKRLLVLASCLVLVGCAGPSVDEKKAASLARDVALSPNNPKGKTLGECLDKSGYPATEKELLDSAQRRSLDDGGTVYRVTFFDEDASPLRVGVVVKDEAVGGWEAGDVAELESLGCIIDGAYRLNLEG